MRTLTRTALILGLVLGSLVAASQAQAKPLTLRINKTEALPGGLVAITLRTYQSRPVHQGQVCFSWQLFRGLSKSGLKAASGPFSEFVGAAVFSANGDVTNTSVFDPVTQTLNLDFFSASATINSIDGPLAVIFFRLSPNLIPGDEFVLDLDPGNTFLFDENNNPIPLTIRSGEMKVTAPGDPLPFDAGGARAQPGDIATLSAATISIKALSQGQATFQFDPSVVTNVLGATVDPRYGTATTSVSQPQPGVAVVSFQSDGTLNSIPGSFLALQVEISASAAVGTSPITLDPLGTFLVDAQGQPVPITSKGDVIEIVSLDEIFNGDFETGGFGSWSVVVP